MRRISKAKKGKAAANDSKDSVQDPAQDAETQGNGNPVASDEDESLSEKKNSPTKKNKRGKKTNAAAAEDAEKDDSEDNLPLNSKAKKGKKGRKGNDQEDHGKTKGEESDEEKSEEEEEEDYEVEKVVDCRMKGGVKQYRIRWKGYEEDRDTWEPEADLSCPDLIEEFLAENPDAFKKTAKSPGRLPKGEKKRKTPANSAQSKVKKQRTMDPVAEEGGEKVYEVEKVVEVHFKRNGEREFLIRWKGFGSEDDTWEPESNLNCTDLIKKFMEKVEKAKEVGMRELRENPQATNRFKLNMHERQRRLSGRHTNRQRTTYYNAE